MQMKGIDVSRWQGDIDFEQVRKSGIEFVIIKAGEWTNPAEMFEENYAKAKDAGLHIGFYWYCDGKTIEEISAEADACINAIEGKQFDFPIYIDLENSYQYNLGEKFCSDAVREFCGKLEAAGYYAGLYTSTSWLQNVIDEDVRSRYTLWVADWRGYCGYEGNYDMWQYGAGYVPGINGKTDLNILDIGYDTDYPGSVVADGVDLDYAYKDFPKEIIGNGLNNYPKQDVSDDSCLEVANTLSIRGATPILSGDRWFLIDESCKFTLETLPYAKVNIYLIGGGQDGAEWEPDPTVNQEAFRIGKKSRGGCVLKKEIYITGNVECQAVVAEPNNFTGTTLKIGNDIYKCNDPGYVHRKATASSNAWINKGGNFNAESGANGVATPYGYVGSSGGGGGAYSEQNFQIITVYAGSGGAGAGNGGEVKCNGLDATNYGCGGGAAGFGGFPSDGVVVETHSGRGRGGCVIFEILDGGACDNPNDNCQCNCSCGGSTTDKLMSGCSCETGGKERCTSYDVQRWGENWLLFDKSGEYSLKMEEDTAITAYLVGGGSDGRDGVYYNKTAYGGQGGRGGYVNVVRDIAISKGIVDITIRIGERGYLSATSAVIGGREYQCIGVGSFLNDGGAQGISGRHGFDNAGNGTNGIETPFGYIGSSGGGGAAYCPGSKSGHGRGGINAGNGGKIIDGKSAPGDKASGYGCGGGGGSASASSYCKGGKGRQGCVILNW